ncbi:MAG: hypothetical protein H6Q63_187 [Firmicutes bacterium]|nr:hypothetical protein [Bacillota bacterium]
MKRKILLSVGAAVMSMGLLMGGTTYALYHATATTTASPSEGTFVAGTVDIDSYRDGFDTIPGPMFYTTPDEGATPTEPSFNGLKPTGIWTPGDTHIRSLIVYNQGQLDAVLDQAKVEVEEDTAGMAGNMNVAIYKVFPAFCLDGTTPFAPLPGDDTLDQDLLNEVSAEINPFILMYHHYFGVDQLAQQFIENNVRANPEPLWSGKLSDLTSDYQTMNPVNMNASEDLFVKHGTLLAFVVQLDKNAGNTVQGATAKFGFTVNARQASNVTP